jgi:hypothetical protein
LSTQPSRILTKAAFTCRLEESKPGSSVMQKIGCLICLGIVVLFAGFQADHLKKWQQKLYLGLVLATN